MSLNGGLGSVTSKFNSLKDTSNCEKLTAVYHTNGQVSGNRADRHFGGHKFSQTFFSDNRIMLRLNFNIFGERPRLNKFKILSEKI